MNIDLILHFAPLAISLHNGLTTSQLLPTALLTNWEKQVTLHITTLDLVKGYWQVPIAAEDQHKIAFI